MRTTCGRLPPGATHCCALILQQEYLETKPWKLINCENVFLAENYDWRTQKQFAFFVTELCLKWKTLNALVLSLNQHLMNRHLKLVHQYGQQHQHQYQHQCQHNHQHLPPICNNDVYKWQKGEDGQTSSAAFPPTAGLCPQTPAPVW